MCHRCPKSSALESISPRAFRRRVVRCWHPLGCRAIELGKPPPGGGGTHSSHSVGRCVGCLVGVGVDCFCSTASTSSPFHAATSRTYAPPQSAGAQLDRLAARRVELRDLLLSHQHMVIPALICLFVFFSPRNNETMHKTNRAAETWSCTKG